MKTRNALHYIKQKVEKDPEAKKYYEEYSRRYDLAQKIRETREAAGLTPKQLAKKTDSTQLEVERLEDPDFDEYSLVVLKRVEEFLLKEVCLLVDQGS